ncbi:MAG: Integral rane protein [Clostridia bacterium]|nr:Integral rane protein [Clostridia bacterium]
MKLLEKNNNIGVAANGVFVMYLNLIFMVFCYSFQALFCKIFSLKYKGNESVSSMIFTVIMGTFISFSTFLAGGLVFNPTSLTIIYGILNALSYVLYNVALIKATSSGPYAFTMIVNLFGGIIVPVLFSALFLNEKLSLFQLSAIIVMLASFVVMNLKGLNLKGVNLKYYIWCFLTFLANGAFTTLIKVQQTALKGNERVEMIMITYGFAAIMCFVFLLFSRKKQAFSDFKTGRGAMLAVLACGVFSTMAANINFYMASRLPAAILFTVNCGGVLILSAIYAVMIFKEKLSIFQVIGIIMSLLSIFMLSV